MSVDPILWVVAGVRMTALFAVAPPFAHSAVPVRLRVGLAAAITWAVLPETPTALPADAVGLSGVVLAEALIGFGIGFAVRLVFAAFDLLGEFVSVQGGLGAATVVDPSSGASSLVLASTLQAFAMLAFFAIDGHHEIVRAAAMSYERLPIGGGVPPAEAWLGVARLGASVFEVAVRLAAPVTVAMFVANLAVGILGRSIPQLNLMMLQLPAHVALTLALLMLGAGALVAALGSHLGAWTGRALALVAGV